MTAYAQPPESADKPEANEARQAAMFAARLSKRYRHLEKWAKRTGAGAYRLYDKDIPEIPLVADVYKSEAETYLAGALYKRNYEKDEADEQRWLAAMTAAAAEALNMPVSHIFIKTRRRQNPATQYQKNTDEAGRGGGLIVSENGLRYKVNLTDYIDTGLFLDVRLLRRRIAEEAGGKKVLNLFCYTGAFSVAAAGGGAALVDSVDISNTYLRWAQENYTLNNKESIFIEAEAIGRAAKPCCRLVRADAVSFLSGAPRIKERYDIIILDPPVFSASKKMRGTLDLKRDANRLIAPCLRLLSREGVLYFSAKTRGFKLDSGGLERQFSGITIRDITESLRDEDYKKHRIPPVWRIKAGGGVPRSSR